LIFEGVNIMYLNCQSVEQLMRANEN
jgi:hypothetical protein